MFAITQDKPGGPNTLRWEKAPDPTPGPNEVIIDIAASAVNRADLLQREGKYPPPPGASDIIGLECSGTIASVGAALTLDRILSLPSLAGTAPVAPAWSPDGQRLAFLWNDAALPRREVWLVEADGSGLRRLTGAAEESQGVRELAWMPDSDTLVYLRGSRVWRTDLDGGAEAVTTDGPRRSDLAVAPDGRHLSFLQEGDLWLVDTETGDLQQATRVGAPPLSSVPLGRYSRPEVEVGPYVWGGPTYAWSPDSRTIAVHHVDRRHLRTVPFPHYLGEETDPNPVRRGYPGDPNEARRVGLYSLETGELTLLDLPDALESGFGPVTAAQVGWGALVAAVVGLLSLRLLLLFLRRLRLAPFALYTGALGVVTLLVSRG